LREPMPLCGPQTPPGVCSRFYHEVTLAPVPVRVPVAQARRSPSCQRAGRRPSCRRGRLPS